MMFIGILAIVVVIYLVLRTNRFGSHTRETEDDALHILRKRFAAGELSEEEFHRMQDELQR